VVSLLRVHGEVDISNSRALDIAIAGGNGTIVLNP
jgi:hypothetical protein